MGHATLSPCSIEAIEARIAPLRERLTSHPLYSSIRSEADLQTFMRSHVFAVWDFMSLLKSLQRDLTCVEVPWLPTPFAASRRFINEIVLGEESDEYQGRPISHFELYLEAMDAAGADAGPIRKVGDTLRQGTLGARDLESRAAGVPAAASAFVSTTFRLIRTGSLAARAAAFTFGREDVIPDMFRAMVRDLNAQREGGLGLFLWYLERHIEVDGEDHGPLSLRMISDLCGEDASRWEEAGAAAEEAIRARLGLWDGILAELSGRAN